MPFDLDEDEKLILKYLLLFNDISSSFKDMLLKMLKFKGGERACINEVITHQFPQSISKINIKKENTTPSQACKRKTIPYRFMFCACKKKLFLNVMYILFFF